MHPDVLRAFKALYFEAVGVIPMDSPAMIEARALIVHEEMHATFAAAHQTIGTSVPDICAYCGGPALTT